MRLSIRVHAGFQRVRHCSQFGDLIMSISIVTLSIEWPGNPSTGVTAAVVTAENSLGSVIMPSICVPSCCPPWKVGSHPRCVVLAAHYVHHLAHVFRRKQLLWLHVVIAQLKVEIRTHHVRCIS